MIEIKHVSKSFGKIRALSDVSLTLEKGHIYGLLGNNGAGKTTLLNLLSNRLYPDAGEILVEGEAVGDNDRALGKLFMMSEVNLYPEEMRVKEGIGYTALFYPDFDRDYAKELLSRFGLDPKKKIKSLSTGYRSIFRIIVSLSTNAPYLLLDEPVLGLDAQHRDLFYRLLLETFTERDCCILLSTHLIQEAANLVDHTILIHNGRILQDADTESLLSEAYTVSGPAGAVENYCLGKELLSVSALGGLKTAAVRGKLPQDKPLGLEFGRMELQEYFIARMNQEEQQ